MKPEPLKDKKIVASELGSDPSDYFCYKPSDIKSAVEWLKHEIDKVKNIRTIRPHGNVKDKKELLVEVNMINKVKIKSIIDKAFEDVVKR